MEEFGGMIFVLLFIAMSVMDGIGRRRKAKQKGAPGKTPGPQTKTPVESQPRPVASGSKTTVSQRSETPASGRKKDQGSEGLIPKEIWDEILGLARGAPPQPTRAEGETAPAQTTAEGDSSSWAEGSAAGAGRVERADATVERRPTRREPVSVPADARESGGVPARQARPSVAALSATASTPGKMETGSLGSRRTTGGSRGWKTRRDLFGDGSAEELRKAIILREVLGPPLGMRE